MHDRTDRPSLLSTCISRRDQVRGRTGTLSSMEQSRRTLRKRSASCSTTSSPPNRTEKRSQRLRQGAEHRRLSASDPTELGEQILDRFSLCDPFACFLLPLGLLASELDDFICLLERHHSN